MSINAWVDKGDEINAPVSNVFFGDGVAMDACGTVLVAFGIMGNGNTPAYGYKYDSGTGAWNNQSLTFAASGGGSSNGAAVSASGDVIFVGEEDYNSYEGRVSVFNDAGGGSWTSPGTVINNPTSTTNEYFGSGIALSRDISGGYPTVLAVGAKEQPWETTNNGGKIYVFQYGAGSYSNISGLTVDGSSGNPGDNLGDYPMQLNSAGTRMILGSDKDRVYVLERDNLADTTWSKVGPTLTAPTNSAYGYYDFGKGASIDGSGDIIAISDPKYGAASDSDGVTGPGQTLIFEYKVPSSAEWSSGDGNSGTDASFGYAGNVYKDGDTTQTTDKKYWVQKGQRIVGNIQTSGGQSGGDKEGKNVKLSRDGNYLLSVGDKALGGVNNYPIDSSGSGNYVTLNYNVDVAGGKFRLWEESQVNLTAFLGNTLVFYQNESTNSTHPLVIGTDTDSGTLSSGPDISYNNSGGSGTVTFTPQTARTYYYYCSNHSGMGSRIDILDNSGTNVTKYVTVYNNGGGNKYYFSDTEVGESDSLPEGELVPGFNVFLGKTLTLDQRHSSNGGNQIEISFTPNGAATEITNNVTYTGAAGNMSSTDPGKFVLNVTDDVYGSGGFYYYSASNNSVDGTPGSDYGNTYGSEVNVRFPIVGKGQTYKYNSSSNEWEYHGTPLWGDQIGTGLGHGADLGDDGNQYVLGNGGHNNNMGIVRAAKFIEANYDTTAPNVTIDSIVSSNSNTTLAKSGDTVTLTFTADEAIQTPTVVFTGANNSDTVTNTPGTDTYTAIYTVASGDTNGLLAFTIDYQDIAGNSGTQVTQADLTGSNVTIDTNAPGMTITSSTVTTGQTSNNSSIALQFLSTEETSNFAIGDITTTGGTGSYSTLLNLSGDNRTFTTNFTPDGNATYSISVPINKFTDAVGNNNSASNTFQWTYDGTGPGMTITSSTVNSGDTSNDTSIALQFLSTEETSDFVVGNISVSNGSLGTLSNPSLDNRTFTAVFTPSGDGLCQISVAENKFTDATGNNNSASNTFQWTYDAASPTAEIQYSPAGRLYRNTQTVRITANFNEDMASSPAPKIEIAGPDTASVSAINMTYVSATEYYYDYAVPTQNGTGIISLRTGTDLAGNVITTKPTNDTETFTVDNTRPSMTISSTSSGITSSDLTTNDDSINLQFLSNKSTTTFAIGDITVSGGTLSDFDGTGTTYTAKLTPTGSGNPNITQVTTINIAEGTFTDSIGNSNTAATEFKWTYDTTQPGISIASSTVNSGDRTRDTSIALTFTSTKSTSNFAVGDISVSGGALSGFGGSGTTYTATLTPTGSGTNVEQLTTINVNAGVFTDSIGNGNTSASQFSWTYDNLGPTLATVQAVPTRSNNTTPTYKFSCDEDNCQLTASDRLISSINSGGGSSSLPVTINNGTNTIIFETLSGTGKRGTEYPTNNNGITVQDAIGNETTIQVNTFTIDTTAPVIEQVAEISTTNNSPTYVFKSDEQGTISVGHASSSALNGFSPTTISSAQVNTNINLTWSDLSEGTYSGYYINVTDDVGNVSNTLTIPDFSVDTLGPTVTQTIPSEILTPSKNNTPSFTFQTTEGGVLTTTLSQGFSVPTNANITSTNTDINFTFNELDDGTYSNVQIIVTDSAGNAGTCTLVPNPFVIDTVGPEITILGDNPATVEKGSTYNDSGATASEGATVIVASNNVNTGVVKPGPDPAPGYTVTYTATDDANNTSTATRTVYVEDRTPPVITLDGDNPMYVEWITGTFTDPGATTNETGVGAVATGSVDVNTINTDPGYIITYNATDSAGNQAESVTRTVYVRDTTAPVITVLGSGTDPAYPITLERGSTYSDAGATANEGLTSSIVTTFTSPSSSIDLPFSSFPSPVLVVGTYTIKYNVSDSAGNAAPQKTRTVRVEDTQINIDQKGNETITTSITSNNLNNNQLAKEAEYVTISLVETGIDVLTITSTALKIGGEDVDPNWVSTSNPGTNVSVFYLVQAGDNGVVTFDIGIEDEHGNSTIISDDDGDATDGTFVTVDTTGPTLTLLCDNPEYIERGTISTYTEPYPLIEAPGGEDITSLPMPGDATYVNPNVVGNYFITYTASDIVGNVTTLTRTITVRDTIPPVITILGSNPFTLERTQSYSDAGFNTNEPTTNTTVFKDKDGNTITEVNTNVSGRYFAQYTAKDPYGNSSSKTRTIVVQDTTDPIITVLGDNPYNHEQYNEYNDPGAESNEGEVTTIGLPLSDAQVNADPGATYTITYSATDAAGNTGYATRVVNIVPDTTAPVITIRDRNPAYVDFGQTYNDKGADSDGGETVTSVSTVDTGVLGQYTVTYSATDTAGNTGTAVRIVYVVDPLDLEKTDVLGGPFNGYSSKQTILNYNHGEQAQIRSQLRSAWNLENAQDSINGRGRAIGAFRAVTNAGDYLSRDNYQCNAPCQVDCVSGANYNTKKNNCDDTGVAAWSGNPKFVYDSSDFIRFKKQQATQDNYNDNAR